MFSYSLLRQLFFSDVCPSVAHVVRIDSNINLEFQKAKHLIDGGFVFIRRYENSSVLIKDFDKLAEKYSECFYRNENSALDVCDGNIVSFCESKTIFLTD